MSEIIVLDGHEFIVAKRRTVNTNSYIYAIANDDSEKFTLLKETIEGNKKVVESVTNEDEAEAVLKIIAQESI